MLSKNTLSRMHKKTQSLFSCSENGLSATGHMSDISNYLLDPDVCNPYTHADIQFDFFDLLMNPSKYIDIDPSLYGTEVAIVGAGSSGMAAANLLLRAGLTPVVYEQSGRIGGRTYSGKFTQDTQAMAELGSMRIPKSQVLVRKLRDYWEIPYFAFPNPKLVRTVFDYEGKQAIYEPEAKSYTGDKGLIEKLVEMKVIYDEVVDPIKFEWNNTPPQEQSFLWAMYVDKYSKVSIYQELVSRGWSEDQLALFYAVGGGTGGMGPFFDSTFLELVRIEIQEVEVEQYGVSGGTEQFPVNLWNELVIPFGQKSPVSVSHINNETTLGQVSEVTQLFEDDYALQIKAIGECNGKKFKAAILTPTPRAIQMTMDVSSTLFSDLVWRAIRQTTLTCSQKTFILTKTAFWNIEPEKFPLGTTLTDQAPAQIYVFDKESFGTESEKGVICLNYSWGDDSLRYAALNDEQRVEKSLQCLGKIYGVEMVNKIKDEQLEIQTMNWETQYGYNGAWRMADPGQEEMHMAMLGQMMGAEPQWDNGLYLAGEALSAYGLSGWIDGAMRTGLIAALSAIKKIGGQSSFKVPDME